jgi:aspartate/methionine/tyrosine aminotransferase
MRDQVSNTSPHNIYLTNGTGEGVKLLISMLIRGKKDGVLMSVPHYPLFSVLTTLNGGTLLPYQLDESRNWALDTKDL